MKKLYFDTLILALLVMVGAPISSRAQEETTTTLTYSTVDELAADSRATDFNEDGASPFIMVNVGTGERINFGGYWGTQPTIHEVGMPLYLVKGYELASGDTSVGSSDASYGIYYKIGTYLYAANGANNGYIGYIRDCDESETTSRGQLFADRRGWGYYQNNYDGIVRMIFTNVGTDADPKYTISFKYHNESLHVSTATENAALGDWQGTLSSDPSIYYLTATGSDNSTVAAGKDEQVLTLSDGTSFTVDKDSELAQWRLVSRDNLIKYFASTNADNNTETVQATFLITDQNFNRSNTNLSAWQRTNVTVGCGSYSDTQDYGAYWVALMDGAGSIYQKIDVPYYTTTTGEGDEATNTKTYLKGWYQLRVKGFSTGTSPAQIYISYGAAGIGTEVSSGTTYDYATSALNINDDFADAYDNSSAKYEIIKQYDTELLAANSEYEVDSYVMLYIPNGVTSFYIGVEADENSGYTMIDDIQLYYAGDDNPLVLKDEWTADELNNINQQVEENGKTRTLMLKRTFYEGQWNSLILPLTLTYSQVKAAFGDNVQLCKLTGVDNGGADIYFTSVLSDKADNDEVIEANKMFIIKPSKLNETTSNGTYYLNEVGDEVSANSSDVATKHTLAAPYYSIPLVPFKATVNATVSDESVAGSNFDSERDVKVYMEGTYVSGTQVPNYSYAINAKDGNWYYLNTTATIKSNGFRAWIRTGYTGEDTEAPSVATLHFDEEFVTDGIDGLAEELGIETAGSVYSLSGQKVSSGSLKGLSKGIYIKNGKKYIVK